MKKFRKICYEPIGFVRSARKDPAGMPVQPIYAKGYKGVVEVKPELIEGLRYLEDFSHIFLIAHMHLKKEKKLTVVPHFHDREKGIFATRAPARPNPIGLSLVRLEKIEGHRLYVDELDLVDGTPILDIKPFTKGLDCRQDSRDGWVEQIKDKSKS